MNNGEFTCDSCRKSYDTCIWRAIQGIQISDETGETWATMFDEDVHKLLKVDSLQLKSLKDNDDAEYQSVLTSANFTEFVFRFSARKEFYQDQQKLKVTVNEMMPFEPVTVGRKMLSLIKQLKEM